ncbi:MAG TPA: Rrf2 family transcriptional regulator [Tepidisphaeraceae bacterium]
MSKKTEYALMALAHLAEQPGRVASAREIAEAHDLPAPLLMNILKNLQGHGVLRSTRGVKGGYQIARELDSLSLYGLIAMVDCQGHATEGDCGCLEHAHDAAIQLTGSHGPVQALQLKLVRFLKDVRVASLVMPGRRIDVPVERLTLSRINN